MFKIILKALLVTAIMLSIAGCSNSNHYLQAKEDGVKIYEYPTFSAKSIKVLAKDEKVEYLGSQEPTERGCFLTRDFIAIDAESYKEAILKENTIFSIVGTRYYRGTRGGLIAVHNNGFDHRYFIPHLEFATDAPQKEYSHINMYCWYKIKVNGKECWLYGNKVNPVIGNVNPDYVKTDRMPSAKEIAGIKDKILGISYKTPWEEIARKFKEQGYIEKLGMYYGLVKYDNQGSFSYRITGGHLAFQSDNTDQVMNKVYQKALNTYASNHYGKMEVIKSNYDALDTYNVYNVSEDERFVIASYGVNCRFIKTTELETFKRNRELWQLFN